MSRRTRFILAAVAVAVLGGVALAVVYVDRRIVYLLGAPGGEYLDLAPQVIETGLPPPHDWRGGLVAADLDGTRPLEILVTVPGRIGAISLAPGDEGPLWTRDVDIRLTGQSDTEGLPGLHAPGVQTTDLNGDGTTEVLFLTGDGRLSVLEGATGVQLANIDLPVPPAGAEVWEHLVVADFRGEGERDLLLQSTNVDGYRIGRYLSAFAISELLSHESEARPLWSLDDFFANAHNGARIADLDGDGRDEVLGGDLLGPDGARVYTLPFEGLDSGNPHHHLDSIFVDDVRHDLPGLEVVGLEERGGQRVFLYNLDGLIWARNLRRQEPQNAAIGDFDPDLPGLEIWCRSRYDRHQMPWVFDARGELAAEYKMRRVAPLGWTVKGVEVISAIDWGEGPTLAVAKERHRAGDVAIFDPMSGRFLARFEEQADRLYVADVAGDGREEIVVLNGTELHVYSNPAPSAGRISPWERESYRSSKRTWNYYSP